MNRAWLCTVAVLAAPGLFGRLIERHTETVMAKRCMAEWIVWFVELLKGLMQWCFGLTR